jgi:predicted protein tyrosine phosphatase
VKNSNVHAILSDVHRLLSQYAPDDFLAASRYSGVSDSIASALLALAREAGSPSHRSVNELRRRREDLHQNLDMKRRQSVQQPVTRDRILEAILKFPRFTNSRTIIEYAVAHGLSISIKPKDGKERLARRLAVAIESAPEAKRAIMLDGIGLERGSQTQGWIDVIKGSRT